MNVTQQSLALCLSKAIRNQDLTKDIDIEIDSLMEEAKAHDVKGLVYKVLKSQYDLKAYQKEILLQSYTQSRYFQLALQTLSKLQEAGIKVVLLKGSVLKSLYPMPDLRTMGDVDILVPKHQLQAVHQVLTELGYTKRKSHNEKHDVYDGQGFHLEVHWSLVNASRQGGSEAFENELWHHLQEVTINNESFLTLSNEDFLVHLLVHAAGHMKFSGFGIRQLADITLWIEAHEQLEWDYINKRLNELNIETFSTYVLAACQQLLHLEIESSKVDNVLLEHFIETIFENGVHGHREKDRQFVHYFAYGRHKQQMCRVWLQCIFPSRQDLSRRYTYAHRYPWLLPLAWMHRIIHVIFHPMFTKKQKLYFFFKTPSLAKQKASLLHALDLSE